MKEIRGNIKEVKGVLRVPSDKSITHRAFIFGGLAKGITLVKEPLRSADTLATLGILKELGVHIEEEGNAIKIEGKNFNLEEPLNVLDAQNSGTTARLMMGVLATQSFFSVITGDSSLRRRPMLRVVEPLRSMGASLDGRQGGKFLPVSVRGGNLKGIDFFNEKSSAQVKSAVLIAGLRAEGQTLVKEKVKSRDHTERMFKAFGVDVEVSESDLYEVKVKGGQDLKGTEVFCPADPSSASFFCALCVLSPEGDLRLSNVLVNPTRDRFFKKLREMGAEIYYENPREISGEPVADIVVRGGSSLRGVEVLPEEVPSLIDEIPILAVVMATAEGVSTVRGAKELRVKESDRIKAIVENLRSMGVKVEEFEDGFQIEGPSKLRGATVKTYSDHRIAMAFTVAGLVADGKTIIDDPECVRISYPNFFKDLEKIAFF